MTKSEGLAGRSGPYMMTVEQRECLAGAEVLRIIDPVTGVESKLTAILME
jgi:hypothetical protein